MKRLLNLLILLTLFSFVYGFAGDPSKKELPRNINATHFLCCGIVVEERLKKDVSPFDYIAFVGELNENHYAGEKSIKNIKKLVDNYFREPQSEILKTITTDIIKNENGDINQIIFLLNDHIIGVTTFMLKKDLVSLDAPKLVGPTKIKFQTNEYRGLRDITSKFVLHSLSTIEPLESKLSIKLGETWVKVNDINNLSVGIYEAQISKRLLCGCDLTTSFTLEKEAQSVSKLTNNEFAGNNIIINLDTTRPTINEVLRNYQKQMINKGSEIRDITILHTNYDKYDDTNQNNYALVSYLAPDGKNYEDRIYILKKQITKNYSLKYNLIATFTIVGVVILSVCIILVKKVIMRKRNKKNNKTAVVVSNVKEK